MFRTHLTSKGQVTVPRAVREQLGIGPGDILEFEVQADALAVRVVPRRRLAEFRGRFPVVGALPFAEERRRARTARTERLAKPA